jgi:hypothetical protein
MSSPFPEEIEQTMDPAETGRHGCLIPQIDDDSDDGHCDAADEEDDDD